MPASQSDSPSSGSSAPAPSRRTVFLRRLASSLVLWSVVIGGLFSGIPLLSQGLFLAIMLTLVILGLIEFYDLVDRRRLACFKYAGLIGGVVLVGGSFAYMSGVVGPERTPAEANDFESGILILFVLGLCLRQFMAKNQPSGLVAISTTLFGLMYVGWLLNFIQKIHFFPGIDGAYYILFFILVTKFSDLGAYAVGSLIGRHKMIPRISPGKTWEGFAGAIVISTLVSVGFVLAAGNRLAGMTLAHAAILGVLLSAAAVVGDLIESLFKREAGVKDSGRWFPGIGGILDLLDSLLFNAPIMYLYLRHVLF